MILKPWSITLLTLALVASACAEQFIRSSALISCMADSQFTASSFDVIFYRGNSSVSFEISAISTLSGSFTAKINVIAYGFSIITESLDLCDISKQLCSMTPGHFDVPLSSETISSSIVSSVPGIAFTIPDLDGIVRVYVYPANDTSTPVACVEATLSNGKTVSTKYASWPIAAVCLVGFVTAGIIWLYGHVSTSAHIASSVVSLFCYFQGIAMVCMMGVDKLPPIVAAWGQNFMWTMGLVSVPFMQDIFNWYVQATGGTSTNILPNKDIMSISVQKVKRSMVDSVGSVGDIASKYFTPLFPNQRNENYIPRDVAYFMSHKALKAARFVPTALARRDTTSVSETTNEKLDDYSSTTLVLRGIQRVAYLANIEITSLFLTGFTFFLIFSVFTILIFVIAKLILELLVRMGLVQKTSFLNYRDGWRVVIKGALYRIVLICFPQLTVLCLWELTKHDSPGTVSIAVITYTIVIGILGFGAYKTYSLARRSLRLHKNPAYILYSDPNALNRFGFLYVQFRATAYYYIIPLLIYLFIKCAFIAFAQQAGKVQAVLIFIIELAYLAFISWKKPYMDKATNGFNIAISAINFVNALFFMFFSSIFGLPAYVSGVMGVVFFILNAVFSLVLIIMIIVSCVWAVVAKNPESRYQPMTDDRESFIPNADGKTNREGTELDALGISARDGYHPSSQELYGAPETLRDDDESFYGSKTSMGHDSMTTFPNERLSRQAEEGSSYAETHPGTDLGTYSEYSSSQLHRENSDRSTYSLNHVNTDPQSLYSSRIGLEGAQPYTGYTPSQAENPFTNPYEHDLEHNSGWRT